MGDRLKGGSLRRDSLLRNLSPHKLRIGLHHARKVHMRVKLYYNFICKCMVFPFRWQNATFDANECWRWRPVHLCGDQHCRRGKEKLWPFSSRWECVNCCKCQRSVVFFLITVMNSFSILKFKTPEKLVDAVETPAFRKVWAGQQWL